MPINNTTTINTDADDESPTSIATTSTTEPDSPTDAASGGTPAQESPLDLEALHTHLAALEATIDAQADRIATLEDTIDTKDDRIDTLETRTEHLEETCERLGQQLSEQDAKSTAQDQRIDAISKKTDTNKQRIAELQSRELEKGAHLREAMVDEHTVDVPDGRLERLTKADGTQYYRLPDQTDPLERGSVSLAYGDLLPIQQLGRMDDEMLRSTANALPTRLAAKLWKARVDPNVGDNPWERGCKNIREYVTASDLKHWIRRQEPGISETYAKKLVSRVIDAILELSKHRVAIRKRTERKNGLEYTERRLVIPDDVDIPGERQEVTNSQ